MLFCCITARLTMSLCSWEKGVKARIGWACVDDRGGIVPNNVDVYLGGLLLYRVLYSYPWTTCCVIYDHQGYVKLRLLNRGETSASEPKIMIMNKRRVPLPSDWCILASIKVRCLCTESTSPPSTTYLVLRDDTSVHIAPDESIPHTER